MLLLIALFLFHQVRGNSLLTHHTPTPPSLKKKRHSALAHIVLPQQIGVDIGFVNGATLQEYRGGLEDYQFWSKKGDPPVPVRNGHHAYDGSFSQLSVVPFPVRRGAEQPASLASALNFTVSQTTVSRGAGVGGAAQQPDNVIVISSNATTQAEADAANLTVAVHPSSYYGAYAVITRTDSELVLDAGELGTLTVSFSAPPRNDPDGRCIDGDEATGARFLCLVLPVTHVPLIITMSFAGKRQLSPKAASTAIASGWSKVQAQIQVAGATVGGMTETFVTNSSDPPLEAHFG